MLILYLLWPLKYFTNSGNVSRKFETYFKILVGNAHGAVDRTVTLCGFENDVPGNMVMEAACLIVLLILS